MNYIKTPVKNDLAAAAKNEVRLLLEKQSTSSLLWFVVKRHKFGIVATWAAVITVAYMFPPLPDLLLSLI